MNCRSFLQKHNNLARQTDEWFHAVRAKHADKVLCGHGCAQCCYGLFGDWCPLNFREGVTPDVSEDLCLDYYEIQAVEQEVTDHLTGCMVGKRQAEVTVFIPSVIAAIDGFWKSRIDGGGA
jgi:hypothetical protein